MATSPADGSPRLRTSERVPSTPSPEPPPTASAIQPCPLLGLSAELRNNVWELAYTFRKESGTETDLLGDQCPTTALLLTCRQIKSEVIGFFEAAESRYWEQDLFVLEREFNEEKCRDVTAQLLRLDDSCVRRMENIYLELNRFEHRVQCVSIPGTNHTGWEICIWDRDYHAVFSATYIVGSEFASLPWRHHNNYELKAEDILRMPEVVNSPPVAPREKIAQAWEAVVKCAPFMYEGMRMKWAHDESNRGLFPSLKLAHWMEEELAANATD